MGRGFGILIKFSILSRIKVAQSSSKGWQLSLQQKFEYARFCRNLFLKKKKIIKIGLTGTSLRAIKEI